MNYSHEMCISFMLLASSFLEAPLLAETNEGRAAAVLLNDFETVFHSTTALLSDSPTDVRSGFPREPFGYLLSGLDAIQTRARVSVLENSEAILVGAKAYHLPIGLGRVRSTRCYVVVLRRESALDLSRYFNKSPVASAAGSAPVWIWSAQLGEFGEEDPRPSALFVAQMVQSYVLFSNDLEELLNVSGHLASVNNGARAFAGIREWNEVRQHEFWGYRKYKHGEPRPIDRIFGTDQITAKAEALIVYVDIKKETGVLRLLSSSADDATARNINATGRIIPFRPVGPKVWETVFPLAEIGAFPDSAHWVLWLVGLGVLV